MEAAPAGSQPDDVKLYCEAIRNPAAEARAAWQGEALLAIERRIEARLAELAALRQDLEGALARREAFLKKAEEGVVDIYSRMRPDAAAAQMASMDNQLAGALLAKLTARQAGAILNEMEPGRAAQLTRTVTDTARKKDKAL